MLLSLSLESSSSNLSHTVNVDQHIGDVDALMKETAGHGAISAHKVLPSAAQYHLDSGGQKIRARICLYTGIALGIAKESLIVLAAAVELLHNASLIHDDIQDHDDLRRGLPTVWNKYGINEAICAGDLLLSSAYGVLGRIENSRKLSDLICLMHASTARAIKGQSIDIAFKMQSANVIEDYIKLAIEKSGALLALPLELVLCYANLEKHILHAKEGAESFAIAYQISDDLEDVNADLKIPTNSPNIVSILESKGMSKATAVDHAKYMAINYCESAVRSILTLPAHSGDYMLSLIKNLKQKCTVKA